jgi:N-acetylglucosamine kinase-like BadF-type ATPase
MPEIVLGIDAGGSKTRALAADRDGTLLGRGEGGAANYHSTGVEAAFAALGEAARRAVEQAGETPGSVRALCLGAAGMARPEDFDLFSRWVAETFPHARARLVTDAHIVLAAGTPEGWGLALISGTGSIAYGRTPAGAEGRAGGWGYLLGDEGSGYDIGLRALRAVTRAADGRGGETALTGRILALWGLSEPQALVRAVYAGLARAEIARLARLVEDCAVEGDRAAASILDWAGGELAEAAAAVVRRLDLPQPVPAALTGGVLVGGERVRAALLASAAERGLRLAPVTRVEEPARGAVRLALEA